MESLIKTTSILPEDHKYLTFLKKVFRHEFRKNGFRRLSVPNFETKDFYEKIFWEDLKKYVYTHIIDDFWDFCLKPSPEILNLKAYLENEELKEGIQPVYSYYMDRYYPKNHDHIEWITLFWWDVVWEDDPIIDAQMIYMTYSILNKIGLSWEFEIRINSIWSKKEQEKIKEEINNFYENKKHLLSVKSLDLLEKNPLKLLSSENEDEKILAENAPKTIKYLKKDSKKHYWNFKEYLDLLWIKYIEDNTLVWEYDYINNNVWEFRLKETWYIISTWYRYNNLSTLIWDYKEVPASWFSVDVWKLIDLLKLRNISIKNKDKLDLYFVQLWDDAKKVVLPLSLQARDSWINTAVSLGTPSMKEQMLKAQRSWAKYVVMVGIMEARNWVFQVRDIEAWTQQEIKKENLIDYIVEKIGKDSLDFYEPSRDLLKK